MPSLREHCAISKERTRKDFADLHKWMDEPRGALGVKHRSERHDSSWLDYVSKRWGSQGVKEFLRHIEIDHKDTREKIEKIEQESRILKESRGEEAIVKYVFSCLNCGCHSYQKIGEEKICTQCYRS